MADAVEHTYTDWLERYRRAWIERDAEAASQLFTDDASYRVSFPDRLTVKGRLLRVRSGHAEVEVQ